MNVAKQNSGVSLVTLSILIIIILVLTGIIFTFARKMIAKEKVENFITNMISIRAKVKVYAEEVNAKVWNIADINEKQLKIDEIYSSDEYIYKMIKIDSIDNENVIAQIGINEPTFYEVTEQTLLNMGLMNIIKKNNDEKYIVVYNIEDFSKIDIIYLPGIVYKNNIYYTLSSLEENFKE